MLNIKPKTASFVTNIPAMVVLSLGFIAVGTFSASAESKCTTLPSKGLRARRCNKYEVRLVQCGHVLSRKAAFP